MLLEIKNLSIYAKSRDGEYPLTENVNLSLDRKSILGLVGESGSGKSITSMAIMGLLSKNLYVKSGEIIFDGDNLSKIDELSRRKLLGNDISMIFQNYKSSLNPIYDIGHQIKEAIQIHDKSVSDDDAEKRALELLKDVEISNPAEAIRKYPHNFSGGQLQRIMIAMSIANKPKLLIADEATTSLDITTQKNIMDLLIDIVNKNDTSLLVISHNLALIENVCHEIAIMYAGKIVEYIESDYILTQSRHPFTKQLIKAIPDNVEKGERLYAIEGTVTPLRHCKYDCTFYDRCSARLEICKEPLEYSDLSEKHSVYCHRVKDERND